MAGVAARASAALEATALAVLPVVIFAAGASIGPAPASLPVRFGAPLLLAAMLAPALAALILRVTVPDIDLTLIALCGALTAIGAVIQIQIANLPGGTSAFFETVATRHLAFVAASFVALLAGVVASGFIAHARRYPYVIAMAALALIASTMAIGTEVNGARLWIELGPLRLQPAEISRVLFATFVAVFLYDRRHVIAASWRVAGLELPPVPYLAPVAGALCLALAALAVQNDLGMAAVTAIGAYAIVASSLRSRWSVLTVGGAVALVAVFGASASPRVQGRVANWLNPWLNPLGTGYQFIQSEYALATGGIAGARLPPDVRNVPEIQTDFVLAAAGSRFGLLVSLAILALLALLALRCAANSLAAATELETLVGLALTVLLSVQILLISGGVLRVVPLTGLTAPFISYGGTSLIVSGFTVGIIAGVGARRSGRRSRLGTAGIARG
ncbi:MAG: FtsW/RodA/SpoVE family cell cycle protein [Thermomicrobiales bacterium]